MRRKIKLELFSNHVSPSNSFGSKCNIHLVTLDELNITIRLLHCVQRKKMGDTCRQDNHSLIRKYAQRYFIPISKWLKDDRTCGPILDLLNGSHNSGVTIHSIINCSDEFNSIKKSTIYHDSATVATTSQSKSWILTC